MDNTASHTCTRFEATYLNLQRIVADPIQSFRCLACKSPQLLPSLPSLLLHFTTEHGVNLLSTAVHCFNSGFSRHADSCRPDELFASCLFYGASGFQKDEGAFRKQTRTLLPERLEAIPADTAGGWSKVMCTLMR